MQPRQVKTTSSEQVPPARSRDAQNAAVEILGRSRRRNVRSGAVAMIRTIAAAGTICGILDGLSAILLFGWFGSSPAQVFQGIASGALGRAARTGGAAAVAVGVIAHFIVAFSAAGTYYAVSRLRPELNEHPVLAGVVFGAAVHLFMTFVVIPLSAIGRQPIDWFIFTSVLVVHLVVVGPSIAITVSRLR